jgi:hypothetical protein
MHVFNLRFKNLELEDNLHVSMIETNCKAVKIFFYNSLAVFFGLLILGFITEFYFFCLMLGSLLILISAISFVLSVLFPYYGKRITQFLSLSVCILLSIFFFYLDES